MTTWARAFMGKSYQAPCFETLSLAVYDGVHGCGICVVHARTSRILLHAQSQGLSADLRPTTLSFWVWPAVSNSGLQREMTTWARAFMGKSYQAPCFETLSLAVYDGVHGCGICVVHARTSRILLHAQSQGLSADLRPTTLSFWAVACCIKQWSPKGNDHVGPCLHEQKLSGTMF